MSDSPPVLVEDVAGTRWITLNRPEKRNAQNTAMLEALSEAIDQTRHDSSCRAVVLQGAGSTFSAGHDLGEIVSNHAYRSATSTAEGRWAWERRLFIDPVERFRELPMPTICVVRGHCLAAGLMFAGTADLVVAAEDAVFGSRIIPAMGINDAEVPALAWILGMQQAKRLLWLGEYLDAWEAHALGLVTWVEPESNVDGRVREILERLGDAHPETLALSKASLRFMEDRRGWREAADYHVMAHQLSHQTTVARAADLERRMRIESGGEPVTGSHRGERQRGSERKGPTDGSSD